MAIASTASLVEGLRKNFLLTRDQLSEVGDSLLAQFPAPRDLTKELQRRGWLTPFQVEHVLKGDAASLLLGEYVILQQIGEGSMGQVFKARHRLMNRIVAIKVVRKDLLSDREAVERFRREIHTAATLSHPNIVTAYDAAQIGDTQLLVMEFVEGKDLGQLVKESGALRIELACNYIRQAALGLQHAHERGLIHRDVKPVNLLVSKAGVVKILDMGLAKLQSSNTNLTQEGALIGTPAYIAPEQGLDSQKADIRSDIYSLGCVLYYLLSGQMPFYGESLAKVLVKHLFEEPTPVEQLRFEVPKGLAVVLRKMMAKSMQARYQAPIDVAEALLPWCPPGTQSPGSASEAKPVAPVQSRPKTPAPPPGPAPRAESFDIASQTIEPPSLGKTKEPVAFVRPRASVPPPSPAREPATIRPGVENKRTVSQVPGLTGSFAPGPWKPTGPPPPALQPRRLLLAIGIVLILTGAVFLIALFSRDLLKGGANPVSSQTNTPGAASTTEPGSTSPKTTGSNNTDSGRPAKVALPAWVSRRSLLDDLDPSLIPLKKRALVPKETVAFLGEPSRAATQLIQSVAFSPDASSLASIDRDGNVLLWDLAKQTPRTMPYPATVSPRPSATAVAISGDGRLLAATTWKGQIFLWDLTGALNAEPILLEGHKETARALAFSPDSKVLATAGSVDQTVKLWDLTKSPPLLLSPPLTDEDGVRTVAFDPLGPTLVSGSWDGSLRLWDLRSRTPKLWKHLKTPNTRIYSVAFSPDGNTLAAANYDKKVHLWDLAGAEPRDQGTLDGHFYPVESVSFSADGKTLASADTQQRHLIVWDLTTRKPRPGMEWDLPSAPTVTFAPDGRHLAVGNIDGTVLILRLANPTAE